MAAPFRFYVSGKNDNDEALSGSYRIFRWITIEERTDVDFKKKKCFPNQWGKRTLLKVDKKFPIKKYSC